MAGRLSVSYFRPTVSVPCVPPSFTFTPRMNPSSPSTSHPRTLTFGAIASHASPALSWRAWRCPCRPEWHAPVPPRRAALFFGPCGGHDGDFHPFYLLDLVGGDLRKDDLPLDAERVVALPVERLARHALE